MTFAQQTSGAYSCFGNAFNPASMECTQCDQGASCRSHTYGHSGYQTNSVYRSYAEPQTSPYRNVSFQQPTPPPLQSQPQQQQPIANVVRPVPTERTGLVPLGNMNYSNLNGFAMTIRPLREGDDVWHSLAKNMTMGVMERVLQEGLLFIKSVEWVTKRKPPNE